MKVKEEMSMGDPDLSNLIMLCLKTQLEEPEALCGTPGRSATKCQGATHVKWIT